MSLTSGLLFVRRTIGWRFFLERALRKSLLPFAEGLLPPVELYVSRNVLPRRLSDAAATREAHAELDDQVRDFVKRYCLTLPHQAPATAVYVLETVSSIVTVRATIAESEELDTGRPQVTAVITGSGFPTLRLKDGQEAIVGGPHGPRGVHRVQDDTLSGQHARFRMIGNACIVGDLGSRNRTFVNGRDIGAAETPLRNHDELRLGDRLLEVQYL